MTWFLLSVAVRVLILGMVAFAAAWMWARFEQLSLLHAAIFGTGAYAYAHAAMRWGMPEGLLIACGAATVLAVITLVGFSRLRGDDYVLASFGAQLTWSAAALTLTGLTGGILGIGSITPFAMRSVGVASDVTYFAAALFGLLVLIMLVISISPAYAVGCAVTARSRELACTLGLADWRIWATGATLYGAFVGLAGATWAAYLTYINAEAFTIKESVTVVAIAALARKRLWATIPAAAAIVGAPELLRVVGVGGDRSAAAQLLLSGIVIALAPVFESPRGHGKIR